MAMPKAISVPSGKQREYSCAGDWLVRAYGLMLIKASGIVRNWEDGGGSRNVVGTTMLRGPFGRCRASSTGCGACWDGVPEYGRRPSDRQLPSRSDQERRGCGFVRRLQVSPGRAAAF